MHGCLCGGLRGGCVVVTYLKKDEVSHSCDSPVLMLSNPQLVSKGLQGLSLVFLAVADTENS